MCQRNDGNITEKDVTDDRICKEKQIAEIEIQAARHRRVPDKSRKDRHQNKPQKKDQNTHQKIHFPEIRKICADLFVVFFRDRLIHAVNDRHPEAELHKRQHRQYRSKKITQSRVVHAVPVKDDRAHDKRQDHRDQDLNKAEHDISFYVSGTI